VYPSECTHVCAMQTLFLPRALLSSAVIALTAHFGDASRVLGAASFSDAISRFRGELPGCRFELGRVCEMLERVESRHAIRCSADELGAFRDDVRAVLSACSSGKGGGSTVATMPLTGPEAAAVPVGTS
jgi:hypothetical protein